MSEKKKDPRGRKALGTGTSPVIALRVPSDVYTALDEAGKKKGLSVGQMARLQLTSFVRD